MHRLFGLAVAASLVAGLPGAGAAATPCEALAARAKALGPQAWSDGSQALGPWLQIENGDGEPTALEAALAKDPAVLKATANEDGNWTVTVERMPGSDIYAASTFQGTLHCQTTAFVEASPGRPARLIDGPPGVGGEGGVCWTQSADFARVFGQPAYVEHGSNSDTTADEDIRIIPWADGRWGRACTLKLRYVPAFRVVARKCRDAKACAALDRKILAIAEAYGRQDQNAQGDAAFAYPSGRTSEAVRRAAAAAAKRGVMESPNWPGFGAEADERPVSSSGLAYFPLKLGSRDYVAAISPQGVGWRASRVTLLILYSLEKGALVPKAGYAVEQRIGALKSVAAQ